MVAQLHDDALTQPEDVQAVHDAIPVEDKKMNWFYGMPVWTSRPFALIRGF